MTCIVAVKDGKGNLVMGGDSAAVAGYDNRIVADPKVFKRGEFLFGYTTSFRMGQILQYVMEMPKEPANVTYKDPLAFLVRHFVPNYQQAIEEGGYESNGDNFLLGYRGEIYEFHGNHQILRFKNHFNAVGCGETYAYPAMAVAATMKQNQTIRDIAEVGLDLAAECSGGVERPFHFVSQGDENAPFNLKE